MLTDEPIDESFFLRFEIWTHTTPVPASLSQPDMRSIILSADITVWGERINSSINRYSLALSFTWRLLHFKVPSPVSRLISPKRRMSGVYELERLKRARTLAISSSGSKSFGK